jgi:hypothetical protein
VLTCGGQMWLGGHKLPLWVRCLRVAGQQGQELLSNGNRGQCLEQLVGSV